MVVLVVPPADELDLVGPVEVFATANRLMPRGRRRYAVEIVTTAPDLTVAGESGLSLLASRHYLDVGGRPDSVLVTSGVEARTTRDRALARWLTRMAGATRRLGSVCVGGFLLAEAGLLHGRRATVHWRYAEEFARRYPRVAVDPRSTWVRDGNIYTSAGITAGIDLALAWVDEDLGAAFALDVARELVLFLRRPGGQAQLSVTLEGQRPLTTSLHALQTWMLEHLHQPLSIERLAERVAMSPRNFARSFVREVGATPARYLLQLRVEAARRLLEQTDQSVSQVAEASGFRSADVLRRAFLRLVGTGPVDYRRHFRTPPARVPAPSPFASDPLVTTRRHIATTARVAAFSGRPGALDVSSLDTLASAPTRRAGRRPHKRGGITPTAATARRRVGRASVNGPKGTTRSVR
jgi:transcriptional regulator GlxA family with amidase domain